MADKSALLLLLLLLVFSSLFLLHEAQNLHPSITKENMVEVVRKGGRGHGGHRGKGGSTVACICSSHNAAHNSYNVSIASFLLISALWLLSLACP
ncbi:hypothetical protein MA16_Dca009674 [Dendrobium catenatum]|uniref:Uncharacterized protein n=1 Tax=Dendrobium catenatum TaxID=906689 RepID=A0A2I0VSQ2_9ASPA|nr:hypothetical protein MA16_Dca009674 [Dendrobium catenatum]